MRTRCVLSVSMCVCVCTVVVFMNIKNKLIFTQTDLSIPVHHSLPSFVRFRLCLTTKTTKWN